jgi:hypothetical protein
MGRTSSCFNQSPIFNSGNQYKSKEVLRESAKKSQYNRRTQSALAFSSDRGVSPHIVHPSNFVEPYTIPTTAQQQTINYNKKWMDHDVEQ